MVIGAAPGGRPREAERWTGPGLWLALGVHGLLLLALALSMNWKMSDPAPDRSSAPLHADAHLGLRR